MWVSITEISLGTRRKCCDGVTPHSIPRYEKHEVPWEGRHGFWEEEADTHTNVFRFSLFFLRCVSINIHWGFCLMMGLFF